MGMSFFEPSAGAGAGSAGAPPFTGPFGGGRIRIFPYSGTFKVPEGVTSVRARLWGGGGRGGINGGSGGAGGGFALKVIEGLTPGDEIPVTVGGEGGTSSFGAHCSATGGMSGGAAYNLLPLATEGGKGIGGDINTQGGRGGSAYSSTSYPGGGGGAANVFGDGGGGGWAHSLNGLSGTSGGGAGLYHSGSTGNDGGGGVSGRGAKPVSYGSGFMKNDADGAGSVLAFDNIDLIGTGGGGASGTGSIGGYGGDGWNGGGGSAGVTTGGRGGFPGGGGGSGSNSGSGIATGVGARGLVIVEY